jgi:hypothetical protein
MVGAQILSVMVTHIQVSIDMASLGEGVYIDGFQALYMKGSLLRVRKKEKEDGKRNKKLQLLMKMERLWRKRQ